MGGGGLHFLDNSMDSADNISVLQYKNITEFSVKALKQIEAVYNNYKEEVPTLFTYISGWRIFWRKKEIAIASGLSRKSGRVDGVRLFAAELENYMSPLLKLNWSCLISQGEGWRGLLLQYPRITCCTLSAESLFWVSQAEHRKECMETEVRALRNHISDLEAELSEKDKASADAAEEKEKALTSALQKVAALKDSEAKKQ